jgi:hypothetical protein
VTLAVTDPRGWLGWKLGELGNGIARLGNRICDDVPTVDHLGEEFQAGCDVVTVQRALGHSKATTTNTYSHLWPSAEDKTRAAAATLAGEVLGAGADNLRAEGGGGACDLRVYTLKRNSTTSPSDMT